MGVDFSKGCINLSPNADIQFDTCAISGKKGWCVAINNSDGDTGYSEIPISIDFLNETLKKFQDAKIVSKDK